MFEKLLSVIEQIENLSLVKKSKVRSFLDSYAEFTLCFSLLTADERTKVRESFSPQGACKLLTLGNYAAEKALATCEKKWISVGLISHVIENFRADYRENIRNLILINYAANTIDVDLIDCYEVLKESATQSCDSKMQAFFARPSSINNLDSVGMSLVKDEKTGLMVFKYIH